MAWFNGQRIVGSQIKWHQVEDMAVEGRGFMWGFFENQTVGNCMIDWPERWTEV